MNTLKKLKEKIDEADKVNLRFGYFITLNSNILLILNNNYSFLLPNCQNACKFIDERIAIQKKLIENNIKRNQEKQNDEDDDY